MKPTGLDQVMLHGRSADDLAVVAPDGEWTIGALRRAGETAELGHARTMGAVALCHRNPLTLLQALIALDGHVDRLLLLASDLPLPTIADLTQKFGAAAILTDRADLAEAREIILTAAAAGASASSGSSGGDTKWVFATSGTTGSPKLVEHTVASLTKGVKAAPGSHRRWGLMYGLARFAGIQVMLQALASGVLLVPDPDWPLGRKLAFLAAAGCDAISATPTLWRKILMTPEGRALQLAQATLGGEVADAAILSAIATRFPDARVSHVYASTEAGASFAITDGLPGFPAAMLDGGAHGPQLRIRDGRLLIRSQPHRSTYVGSDIAFADADGFVDTGDMVDIVGDRCLFRGRANGAINVGGDKLYPQEVESLLLAHPDVAFARIYARNSPITGQIVMADVVPRTAVADNLALTRTLQAHCAQHLPRWKCPAAIRLVPDVAADPSGKIGRAG
jgi:acyl-coenzyme A synthetase/AMP-(fatty) acid ligase